MKQKIHTPLPARRRSAGFTLIEVMIVVAIIAIIAAVGLPSYTQHVAKARRADARAQLLQAAHFMQRFYAANDQYDLNRAGKAVEDVMPEGLKRSPVDGAQYYSLTIEPSVSSYTLTMAPVAGGAMASDPCGGFRVTSTGARSVTGSKPSAECWK